MMLETFFEKFDLFADAPDAVAKLRELLTHLAVAGRLVSNDPNEKPVGLKLSETSDKDSSLPSNWRSGLLGEVFVFEYGDNLPATKRSQSGEHPVYGSNGIVGTHDTYLTKEPAIIVGRKGSAGALNIATGPSWTTDVAYFVRPPKDLDLRFTYYLFSTLRLDDLGKGIKPGLSRKEAYELPIALPPLAEQKRIVAKVDELMALCDRLEAQQQERETRHAALARASLTRFADAPTPVNLDLLFHKSYSIPPADLRKSILTLAVQGKLVPQDPNDEDGDATVAKIAKDAAVQASENEDEPVALKAAKEHEIPFELPASWTWARLGMVAGIKHGFAFQSESFTSEPTAFVVTTPGNFYEKGGFRDRGSKTKYYRGDFPSEFVLNPGDLIIPMTEQAPGLLGSPAFIPDDGKTYLHNQRLGKLLFHPGSIIPEFAFWFFNTPFFRGELAKTCTGMKVRHTSPRRILTVPFPVCSPSEQRRIVAKVDELMALVDTLETQLATARTTGSELVDAVVAELTAEA